MSKTLEELGYEKRENSFFIIYQSGREKIFFDKANKDFSGEILDVNFSENGDFVSKPFTMEELKAIYKYCEDNKWI